MKPAKTTAEPAREFEKARVPGTAVAQQSASSEANPIRATPISQQFEKTHKHALPAG